MPDITIKDFRGGLDARKFFLSSPGGTFIAANNGHINQGAEFEKRKAFVRLANSSGAVNTSLPANTFGWQSVPAGHLVFGSVDGSALTFPSGVTYQRLQHPAVLNGTAYNGALHAMTWIVCSRLMGGQVFAVAQFADGNSFAYYAGVLVNDFTSGLILAYLAGSDSKIAAAIVALVNKTVNYTATQRGSTGLLDVLGLVAELYTTTLIKTSAAGTLAQQLLNNGLAAVAGVQAVGQFQIVTGTVSNGVNYISSVKVNGVECLLNAASINFQTNEATTAAAVANSISSNAPTSGYYAVANGALVSIIPLVAGAAVNGYNVVVKAAGNVCIGACSFSIGGASTTGMTSIMTSAVLETTAYRSHSGTTATLVIAGTNTFVAGNVVTVSGLGNSTYNGSFTITAVGTTTINGVAYATISYTTASLTEGQTADTGGSVVYSTGVNIMGGAVAGSSNGLNTLAANIVTAINSNTGTTGFLANSVGSTIYIARVTTSSADAPLNVVVTTAGNALTVSTTSGATTYGLTTYALASTESFSWVKTNNLHSASFTTKSQVMGTLSVILGGTTNPPYTYLWTLVSSTGSWSVSDKTSATPTFSYAGGDAIDYNTGASGNLTTTFKSVWQCTITDASGAVFTTQQLQLTMVITGTAT